VRPSDDRSGELMRPEPAGAAELEGGGAVQRTTVLPPLATAVTAGGPPEVPAAELAGMLLPTEHVTFASSPHPVVFVRPIVHAVAIVIVFAVALGWQTHPIVRGHHVTVPLLAGSARVAVVALGALLLLREGLSLLRRLFHFLAFRVVSTNRRVFVVEGLFGRRVAPLGNTALAGATMSQGLFGRIFGYGNLFLPLAGSGPRAVREMRDPVRLYRELEAVANGVEGDTWKQAIRQTQIP
jgi:hypothetical protein